MILYVIITVILLYILYVGYYKIRYRFWTLQPVFHRYQWWNWFFQNRLINADLPEVNKYLNPLNISVKNYEEIDKNDFNIIISLYNKYSRAVRGTSNSYSIKNLEHYLVSHNHPVHIAFHKSETYLQNIKSTSIMKDDKINGFIISRPLHMVTDKIDTYINYVEDPCINTDILNENNHHELINTLEYKQRHNNSNIKISLYKTDKFENCIVPFVTINTYLFDMKYWKSKQYQLPAGINIIHINKSNDHIFFNFLHESKKTNFKCSICPDVSNITELLNKEVYKVYALLQHRTIIAAYIFKSSNQKFRDKEIIECIGSISNCKDKLLFVFGFVNTLRKINTKNHHGLRIDNISYNGQIIENIMLRYRPYIVTKQTYFLYNFIHKPFGPKDVFILG